MRTRVQSQFRRGRRRKERDFLLQSRDFICCRGLGEDKSTADGFRSFVCKYKDKEAGMYICLSQ